MANNTVLLEDWRDMRLEPRSVWLLRQYCRRGDRQRNRWRHETQGEPNYRRKRTGVHCTGSIIRSGVYHSAGCLGLPDSRLHSATNADWPPYSGPTGSQQPQSGFAVVAALRGFQPERRARTDEWKSLSGLRERARPGPSLARLPHGYWPSSGEWHVATSAPRLVRPLCGDTLARAAPTRDSNVGHSAIHWVRASPHCA